MGHDVLLAGDASNLACLTEEGPEGEPVADGDAHGRIGDGSIAVEPTLWHRSKSKHTRHLYRTPEKLLAAPVGLTQSPARVRRRTEAVTPAAVAGNSIERHGRRKHVTP